VIEWGQSDVHNCTTLAERLKRKTICLYLTIFLLLKLGLSMKSYGILYLSLQNAESQSP